MFPKINQQFKYIATFQDGEMIKHKTFRFHFCVFSLNLEDPAFNQSHHSICVFAFTHTKNTQAAQSLKFGS